MSRATNSTGLCTKPSMAFILRICGCRSSAIRPISLHRGWRSTKQVTPGDTFVSCHVKFVLFRLDEGVFRGIHDVGRPPSPSM